MIEFTVYGQPRPAGSKRAFMRPGMKHPSIVDACKGSREWKNLVSDAARQAYQGPLLDGALFLELTFYVVRPKGHYKGGKPQSNELAKSAPRFPVTRPDATKYCRAVEDALTGIVWRDDAQIVCQVVRKKFADPPGVLVQVQQLNNEIPAEERFISTPGA